MSGPSMNSRPPTTCGAGPWPWRGNTFSLEGPPNQRIPSGARTILSDETTLFAGLGGSGVFETSLGSVTYTKLATAVFVVLLLGFIIFGGVKRIAHFTQIVVPFMALGYILMALVIIGMHITQLPGIIMTIVNDAFTPMAGLGAAIGWGVKRGVYSNEAGQGTGPHAAAASEVEHPAQQGLVQAFSVYVDTLFVCSATAFMILITNQYYVTGIEATESGGMLSNDVLANSPAFTQYALESVVGGFGKTFVAFALFFFAFTTILAYYYIAETNVAYIRRSIRIPGEITVLKFLMLGAVFMATDMVASPITNAGCWLYGAQPSPTSRPAASSTSLSEPSPRRTSVSGNSADSFSALSSSLSISLTRIVLPNSSAIILPTTPAMNGGKGPFRAIHRPAGK